MRSACGAAPIRQDIRVGASVRQTDFISPPSISSSSSGQKLFDGCSDFGSVGFEREMAGIEEADRGIRDVTFVCLGAGWEEEGVVLAPCRQQRRSVRTEVVLKLGIQGDVALVVAK